MQTASGLHRPAPSEDFAEVGETRWEGLVTTAFLLTGDFLSGEELARGTLARTAAQWRRVPRDDVDFHLRRRLIDRYVPSRRQPRRRRAARHHVAVVLRYGEGLPDVEIAQLLGCGVRAVRRHVRRGLTAAGQDAEQARAAFAEQVGRAMPSAPCPSPPVPGGRARRRMVAVAAGCLAVLVLGGLVVTEQLRDAGSPGQARARTGAVQDPIRVVASGERVAAPSGTRVWLTADGMHWSAPGFWDGFTEVTDDERTADRPGVTAAIDAVGKGKYLLSGLYYGLADNLGRIQAWVGGKRITAKPLTLASSPGWGIWYAKAPDDAFGDEVGEPGTGADEARKVGGRDAPDLTVTVLDTAGKVVARNEARG